MKHTVYVFKEWIKAIFCYPKKYIDQTHSSDYDKYWQEKRGKNIGDLSSWQKERAHYILRILRRGSERIQIADVGCGDGSILFYLKNNLNIIQKCIGYDNSEFALNAARNHGVETYRVDISDKVAYTALQEVDYYLLLEVLEHVPHSEELMFQSLTKARKGIFLSFPNTGYVTHRVRMMFGRFPCQWRIFPNEHVRFWTYMDVKWWLQALKIENYEIHCYKGVPILNKFFPSIFAAGFVIFIKK